MEIKQSNRLTSFPVYEDGDKKHTFSILRMKETQFVLREDVVANGAVVEFEGHKVKEPDYYRFVETNPCESLKFEGYVRVAIAQALDILNSYEEVQ